MNTHGGSAVAHGVIVAPLRESHPDRIVLADRVLFLRDGPCPYPVCTPLEVEYTERDGRSTVENITPTKVAQ